MQDRLPFLFVDPDPVEERADNCLSLLGGPGLEHVADISEALEEGGDHLFGSILTGTRALVREGQVHLKPLALGLEAHECRAHARRVVGARGEGGDEPLDPPLRLVLVRLQFQDRRVASIIIREAFAHAVAKLLGVYPRERRSDFLYGLVYGVRQFDLDEIR